MMKNEEKYNSQTVLHHTSLPFVNPDFFTLQCMIANMIVKK